jgi:ribosome-associated toxin RatA of RatAB toxin-antitoxin module
MSELIGQNPQALIGILKSGMVTIVHERGGEPYLVTAGALVNVSVDEAYSVISNFGLYHKFVPSAEKVRIIRDMGNVKHVEFNFKLKFSILTMKVFYVLECHYEKAPYRIWWVDADGYPNELKDIWGGWEIIPMGRNRSAIFYSEWSDLRTISFIMDWVLSVSPELETTLHTSIASTAVRAMAERIRRIYGR